MLQYISKDLFSQLPEQIKDTLIRVIGKTKEYEENPEKANEFFTVGIMIELINKHIVQEFHIKAIYFRNMLWRVDSAGFSCEETELSVALWKALVYCFDEEKRLRDMEEKEKIWRKQDELVTIRRNS